jgi:hypothetical protein
MQIEGCQLMPLCTRQRYCCKYWKGYADVYFFCPDQWEPKYFLSRWKDYEEAAKMTGKDKAIKLLKRREEQLRKNITV